jgi:hypothetical protein
MGWEPALPPAKCFEGVCLCQFELHRDLRPQAAGAQYLPSSYGFGIESVKQDLTRDHRPTSCFPGTHTGRFKCYRLMNSSPNRSLAQPQRKLTLSALCEFMSRAANDSYTAAEGASAPGVRCKTR